MRAKVISVLFVACGVLGSVAFAAAPSTTLLASRGGGHGGGHESGDGAHDNTYNHSCTSQNRSVVGNVCVIVNDLPILGSVLAA